MNEHLAEETIAPRGKRFAAAVVKTETGRWEGPIESGFGLHLVFVTERIDGRLPALSEIRDAVEREFLAERRRRRVDALYEGLLKNKDEYLGALVKWV